MEVLKSVDTVWSRNVSVALLAHQNWRDLSSLSNSKSNLLIHFLCLIMMKQIRK